MARIYGTIESLKSLKSELYNNGITRFSSVKDINYFMSNYKAEKLSILKIESDKLEHEYFETCANLEQSKQRKIEIVNLEREKIENQISEKQTRIDSINAKELNFLKKLIFGIKLFSLEKQLKYLVQNKTELINSSIKDIAQKIEEDEIFIREFETEKQNLIEERAKSKIEELEHIQNVLENSRNLIAGAIGENLVAKEIKKLSDDYVLINDFGLSFSSPIFYKKQNQRISSIQIDHLLISRAGIFIIETKNWSKESINSMSLRSPIEQIRRTGFALYVYISKNVSLDDHHWGEKKVPIRNVIVMINNKPKGAFKYVSIKLLRELTDYIEYFEPVLTDRQFNRIKNELILNKYYS